jgi:hypothetical protein
MAIQKEVKAKEIQIGTNKDGSPSNHYKQFVIQPIDFIHKNNLSFIQGNIIKYACRYKDKNGIEDLKKIKHYVDLLIELEEENEN